MVDLILEEASLLQSAKTMACACCTESPYVHNNQSHQNSPNLPLSSDTVVVAKMASDVLAMQHHFRPPIFEFITTDIRSDAKLLGQSSQVQKTMAAASLIG